MKYVLISDGSSDRALINIIGYAINQRFQRDFEGERADLSFLKRKITELPEKILSAIDLYEPDIIFIHRDTEKQTLQKRVEEIQVATSQINHFLITQGKYATVIPIRMTESWLMIDEKAIRKAAGNPNGKEKLALPKIHKLESVAEPKDMLEELIRTASGLTGRRLRDLNTRQSIQLIPEYLEDFSPLEQLTSYQYFKTQVDRLHI